MGFIPWMQGLFKNLQVNLYYTHINKMKAKKHMTILIDVEKAFN